MGDEIRIDLERRGTMGKRRNVSRLSHRPRGYYLDDERRRGPAFLIPIIVTVNVVMFIITMYVNNCPKNSGSCAMGFLGRLSFQPVNDNPLLGPSASTLSTMGALDAQKVAKAHQVWRFFTCIWLHAGFIHLLVNMLSLLFIGIRLEQEFGFKRVGSIYFLSAFGGGLLSDLFLQDRISVGASGALFGIIGAMISELITNWTIYTNKCTVLTTLFLIVALNIVIGIFPHVDNFAHIGGLVSGFLLGFIFLMRPQFGWDDHTITPPIRTPEMIAARSKHTMYQYFFWAIALTLVVVGFFAGMILAFRGVNANETCSWCHYLSCVPSSRWKCDNGRSRASCKYVISGNTLVLTCENNNQIQVYSGIYSESDLRQFCSELCSED